MKEVGAFLADAKKKDSFEDHVLSDFDNIKESAQETISALKAHAEDVPNVAAIIKEVEDVTESTDELIADALHRKMEIQSNIRLLETIQSMGDSLGAYDDINTVLYNLANHRGYGNVPVVLRGGNVLDSLMKARQASMSQKSLPVRAKVYVTQAQLDKAMR